MPELPEVETIRRDLAAVLGGQTISATNIISLKTVQPSPAVFKKSLMGRRVEDISRRGKLLVFRLTKKRQPDAFLLVHLKMTGQLIYRYRQIALAGGHSAKKGGFREMVESQLPNKHTRAVIAFRSGARLFFNDLRRFGYLKSVGQQELENILAKGYGPEPLSSEFSLGNFQEALKGGTGKIKALLLDQKLIAGLGNIYVDESLFAARIRPTRPARSLKPIEIKRLWQEINKVIRKAIRYRGTTFSDYRDPKGGKGNFSRFLQVYGRSGESCPACGRPLAKAKIAGRGTHYCQFCQK